VLHNFANYSYNIHHLMHRGTIYVTKRLSGGAVAPLASPMAPPLVIMIFSYECLAEHHFISFSFFIFVMTEDMNEFDRGLKPSNKKVCTTSCLVILRDLRSNARSPAVAPTYGTL